MAETDKRIFENQIAAKAKQLVADLEQYDEQYDYRSDGLGHDYSISYLDELIEYFEIQ